MAIYDAVTTFNNGTDINAIIYLSGCNLACPFCFNKDVVHNTGADLSYAEVKEYVDRFQSAFPKDDPVEVIFSGGEPTISSDFNNLIELFKDYKIGLQTNGLYIPPVLNNYALNSAVISVKPFNVIKKTCYTRNEYIEQLISAAKAYNNSKYKEFRIVNDLSYAHDYIVTVTCLKRCEAVKDWNFVWVDPIKINKEA